MRDAATLLTSVAMMALTTSVAGAQTVAPSSQPAAKNATEAAAPRDEDGKEELVVTGVRAALEAASQTNGIRTRS